MVQDIRERVRDHNRTGPVERVEPENDRRVLCVGIGLLIAGTLLALSMVFVL
jgi:hypothetical protein